MAGKKTMIVGCVAVFGALLQSGCTRYPTDIGQRNNPLDTGGTVCQYYTVLGGTGAEGLACLAPTTDGGCVAAGRTMSYGAGNNDVWLVRVNAAGTPVWEKTFGTGANDLGLCVRRAADGGFYVLGQSTSTHIQAFLIRTNADGAAQWSRYYSSTIALFPYWVAVTRDGGALVCGYGTELGNLNYNGRIIRYAADGNLQWVRIIGDDVPHGIDTMNGGGFVLSMAGKVASYDDQGQLLWERTTGLPVATRVFATPDGFVTYSSYHVARHNAIGEVIWSNTAAVYGVKAISSVRPDQGGTFILSGASASSIGNPVLCLLGSNGSPLRSLTVVGAGSASDAARASSGGCLLGGVVAGTGGSADLYLYMTKPNQP